MTPKRVRVRKARRSGSCTVCHRLVLVGYLIASVRGGRWHCLEHVTREDTDGGRNATFEVAQITPPTALVYWSSRGRISLTWSITLEPAGNDPDRTRVFLRLRMAPLRHKLLARTAGGLIDLLTIAGMAAGLAERLRAPDTGT